MYIILVEVQGGHQLRMINAEAVVYKLLVVLVEGGLEVLQIKEQERQQLQILEGAAEVRHTMEA